ncbi:MAG TPA: cytochrome c [Acidobacteriota bacterium]|nr:cytochrome c [Acidobacteriota bacterium]
MSALPILNAGDSGHRLRVILLCVGCLALAGCARGCASSRPPIQIVQDMDTQPKYKPQRESDFFYDGMAMRRPVEGTVARGQLREDAALYTGREATGEYVSNPLPVTEALLQRGGERYQIYCTPCHGERGDGESVLRERGGIQTGDLLQPDFVQMSDGELFEVVTEGRGLMPGYRYPIPPEDRWAIIAFLRTLQDETSQ